MEARPLTGSTSHPSRARSRPSHRGRGTPHRLTVLGCDAQDVVASVGGVICDRSMAGWDVLVYLADPAECRSLQILGVATADRLTPPMPREGDKWPDVVLVSAQLYTGQPWIRKHVSAAGRKLTTKALLWGGQDRHPGLPKNLQHSEHRLSSAARAFKEHAIRLSANMTAPVASTEHLLCHGQSSELWSL